MTTHRLTLAALLSVTLSPHAYAFRSITPAHYRVRQQLGVTVLGASVETAPFEDIIPFLSEHIQQSDMILFVGASTDLSLQLVKSGYGTKNTGYIKVIDSDEECLKDLQLKATADPEIKKWVDKGNLSFKLVDFTNMPDDCQQSTVDAIVDYGGLDSLHSKSTEEGVLKCIDHLQDAVRLGNILVCLSKLEKAKFCSPFESRFGWVQELDGDPGEISAWYRGKTNIQATKSNFEKLGLKMYVYTNTDNC